MARAGIPANTLIFSSATESGKTWKNEVKECKSATHPSRWNAATNTPPISPTPGSAANRLSLTATCPTTSSLTTCHRVPASSTVLATRNQLEPIRVGSLPASCAMLTNLSAQIEMLTVEGSLSGDPEMIYQAIAHDPLTSAKLSLAEPPDGARDVQEKQEIPKQFKKIDI